MLIWYARDTGTTGDYSNGVVVQPVEKNGK